MQLQYVAVGGQGEIKTIQMLWELTCDYSGHTELQTVAIIEGKL